MAAAKAGLHKHELDASYPRVDEIPFTSETKRMTTLHRTPDGVVAYSKGAPEVILEGCSRLLGADGERALEPDGPGASPRHGPATWRARRCACSPWR